MGATRSLFPILMVVALTACGRPDVLTVEGPRPARAPDSVTLLLDVPDRPFRTLALIRSGPRNPFRDVEDLTEEVRSVAAEMGADAVILSLSSQGGSDTTGVSTDGQVLVMAGGSESLRVVGRAIVYTDG